MNAVVDVVTLVDFNDGGYNFVGGNNEWAGLFRSGKQSLFRENNSKICC